MRRKTSREARRAEGRLLESKVGLGQGRGNIARGVDAFGR